MEYILVNAIHHQDFIDLVNEKIRDGWVPQGGIAMTPNRYNTYTNSDYILKDIQPAEVLFSQAMIKKSFKNLRMS